MFIVSGKSHCCNDTFTDARFTSLPAKNYFNIRRYKCSIFFSNVIWADTVTTTSDYVLCNITCLPTCNDLDKCTDIVVLWHIIWRLEKHPNNSQAMSVEAAATVIISAAAVWCANWQTAAERVWQRCLALKHIHRSQETLQLLLSNMAPSGPTRVWLFIPSGMFL